MSLENIAFSIIGGTYMSKMIVQKGGIAFKRTKEEKELSQLRRELKKEKEEVTILKEELQESMEKVNKILSQYEG